MGGALRRARWLARLSSREPWFDGDGARYVFEAVAVWVEPLTRGSLASCSVPSPDRVCFHGCGLFARAFSVFRISGLPLGALSISVPVKYLRVDIVYLVRRMWDEI